jgi:hypothetical protein
MVGNLQPDNSGNILVEFDYDNIIIVDPNKTIDYQGNIKERLVDHENLVMYANLEAEVLPRTKLAVGGSPQDTSRTISIAKINFLGPNKKDYFATTYYDELTGKDTTSKDPNGKYGMGANQKTETLIQSPNRKESYNKSGIKSNGIDGSVDNGLLGITSILVKITSSFIPTVSITMEDVQGKALFSLGDQSPYAAFFNMPYPPFYLTLKGYFGKAIRYQLNLKSFNARFNTFSGNYQVNLEFQGFKFGILNEVQMQHLLAAPHMYSTIYNITRSSNPTENVQNAAIATGNNAPQPLNTNNNQVVSSLVTEKGYEKIVEVYSEYKAKKLLPKDFPEITFYQLIDIIQTFETRILESFTEADVQPLTDCRDYKGNLKKYADQVLLANDSWFIQWVDPVPIILKNGGRVYTFKENSFNVTEKNTALEELKRIIGEYTETLANAGTLGKRGKFPIINPIKFDTIVISNFDTATVDLLKSAQEKGIFAQSVDSPEVENYKQQRKNLFTGYKQVDSSGKESIIFGPVFDFDGFLQKLQVMETSANRKQADYESLITTELSKKIEDPKQGIGFRPSIRNIVGIIMATTEGFLRLLDDVHTKAWSLRNDPIRKSVYTNQFSVKSSDLKGDEVQISTIDSTPLDDAKELVYPWPQFFVETNKDVEGRFQLTYLADPSVVGLTKADEYDKWPEVEFVEEYCKGLTQKFDIPVSQPPLDTSEQTNLININAIEYPQLDIAYRNKDELKFFYEIWERQFVTAYYTGLGRTPENRKTYLTTLLQDLESQNIELSLGVSTPYLNYKLKNYDITANNYLNLLKGFSNQGTGRSWQDFIRDFFVTPYLRTLTDKSFSILEVSELGPEPQKNLPNTNEQLRSVIEIDTEPNIMDTYPFINDTWCETNLVGYDQNKANKRYNTNAVLEVFEQRNVISNFNDLDNYNVKRPVTNFCYLYSNNPNKIVTNSLLINEFYNSTFPSDFPPTVGYTFTDSPARTAAGQRQLPIVTTTSMLNTPFFINSISKGVDNLRRSSQNPFKAAAYLFLNSLPLISLREKLKSTSTVTTTADIEIGLQNPIDDLNYMFASLKKYGAIHKLPYAWILKMGSIWHRYKTFKQTGGDILSDVWSSFNFVDQYDPITRNVAKTYSYVKNGQEQKIQLQSGYSQINNIEVGFYPKTINDFNVFYNGYDLFKDYTDDEIQSAVNRGMNVYNFPTSNISNVQNGSNSFNVKTWSVLIPANIEFSSTTLDCKTETKSIQEMYVMPSFGTYVNESEQALVNGNTLTQGYAFAGNPSVFNGSVRLFWAAPNFGYFDFEKIKKPKYDEYINVFKMEPGELSPFRFSEVENYMKIDDIFSVFEKKILDTFETEFLNFSKPATDLTTGFQLYGLDSNGVDNNSIYRNFQAFFSNMMKVPFNTSNVPNQTYFLNTINTQYENIQSKLASFLEYDVIFRYGNPTNYNKRIFDSYLYPQGLGQTFIDPIKFEPYVEGSLPSQGGTTTLQQSKTNYPKEWLELELEVGFSTIPQLVYKDNGSFITDFFIDNNIKFTVENIQLLSPLIKIYATQKLQKSSTVLGVKRQLEEYFAACKGIQDLFIDGVLNLIRKKLPNQSQVSETVKPSIIDGQQSKINFYEMFKSLNDKWVAGYDFETKTLFEDILFLDRASRNIGDILLVDIFDLKTMLTSAKENDNKTVQDLITSLMLKNKFNVMNLPAYVNFYNVQDVDGVTTRKPEGSLDFANNLWGTFLNVDYRESSPKLVGFFVGKPSNYPALPKNKYFRYRNDGFDFGIPPQVPLRENLSNKSEADYAKSNRCVGFNVDIGIKNQNVFYSFQVGQDNGKATSESVQQTLNTININSGTQTATQNTSLYNFYLQRTYPCTVESLGNAMIQPAMYFNLRNVPMFYGPYLITDVEHTISPGVFQTQFTGVRQGIFDLPQIDKYLQSINQNLLTRIETVIRNKVQKTPPISTTNNQTATNNSSNNNNTSSTLGACDLTVNQLYLQDGFVNIPTVVTKITKEEMIKVINSVLTERTGSVDPILQRAFYVYSYISSQIDNGQIVGYNNNYCNKINLTNDYKSNYKSFFDKTYCCVDVADNTVPFANFDSTFRYFDFLNSRMEKNKKRIVQEGLNKYFYCFFNPSGTSVNTYNTLLSSNTSSVKIDSDRMKEALNDMNKLATITNLNISQMTTEEINKIVDGTITTANTSTGTNPQNNLNTQDDTKETCEKPTIINFNPTGSTEIVPITLSGTNLIGKTMVYLNGSGTTINENTQTKIVFVPQYKSGGKIKVVTTGGEAQSTTDFTFLP